MFKKQPVLLTVLLSVFLFQGCANDSYPASRVKEALQEICRTEYHIDHIEVKISGNTIGVFLPLDNLFSISEALETGDLEKLRGPAPEAMEKIEDVLFSMSRVLLSTDLPLDFYVLQATDVENTGMQLVVAGYVNDIRRVKIWDISRDEYGKRLVREFRYNRTALWHHPVRSFFAQLPGASLQVLQEKYFHSSVGVAPLKKIFGLTEDAGVQEKSPIAWEIEEIKSTPIKQDEVAVYVKVHPEYLEGKKTRVAGPSLKYLFMMALSGQIAQIQRVVPFQYYGDGQWKEIPLPSELTIENSDKWEEEFDVQDIQLGPFLAEQLTRRVQGIIYEDERMRNTFEELNFEFVYHEDSEPAFFSLSVDAMLKENLRPTAESLFLNEDILYFLNLASREFVTVTRSYGFGDYQQLRFQLVQDETPVIIGRDDLELFRRNKIDLRGLLSSPLQLA